MMNMNEKILKSGCVHAKITTGERTLLEAVCNRAGWNLSEAIRRAIVNLASEMGIFYADGKVVVSNLEPDQTGTISPIEATKEGAL